MREVEIRIDGLAVFARHGVLPAERELGQRFYVDLVLVPASDLLEGVPLERATVRVRKPSAPVPAVLDEVSVAVTRTRGG